MESKPTHEQAQLHLQVYDLRREAKLRQARDWFTKNYIVNNIDDAMRIAPMGSERGAYAGMVVKPVVPAFRERFAHKQAFSHLEQAAKRYEAWSESRNPGHISIMRQIMQQMRAHATSTAKA